MTIENPKKVKLTHTICFMFSGKAGVGKSYSADLLKQMVEEYNLNTFKSPFAAGVKATARFMGWDGNKDQKGRRLLQRIGQSGREYDENLWVKSSFQIIENSDSYPYDVVFIDDWRFPNEISFIQKNELLYKTIAIRVEAPDREILVGTPEYDEVSEVSLDDYKNFNFYLNNRKECTVPLEVQLRHILNSVIENYGINQ